MNLFPDPKQFEDIGGGFIEIIFMILVTVSFMLPVLGYIFTRA